MKPVIIYWEDQFKVWQRYTAMYHQPSAVRTAQQRASKQNRRYKITDEKGNLLDLIYPEEDL